MPNLSLLSNTLNATLAALIVSVAVTAPAAAEEYPDWADTPEERQGYDIAARADRSDNGFGDSRVDMKMILRNKAGQETVRDMTFTTLERADETVGDKSLVVFESPRDVEGTALLSHAKLLESDDQWLFLPDLGRRRRISSANKSGPFLGSEFAFEDFTSLELGKYSYVFKGVEDITIGEETFTVDVVERVPLYERSGYTRQMSYVDQEIFQVRRVEFFDRRDQHLKTLELTDYREYGEGIWRAQKLSMFNKRTGKQTDLVYDTYEFSAGLDDNDFVPGVLN